MRRGHRLRQIVRDGGEARRHRRKAPLGRGDLGHADRTVAVQLVGGAHAGRLAPTVLGVGEGAPSAKSVALSFVSSAASSCVGQLGAIVRLIDWVAVGAGAAVPTGRPATPLLKFP